MFICKFCGKNFSVDYQLTKGYSLSFCSKSCKTKSQRDGYQTKESLVGAIKDFIKNSKSYQTKEEILKALKVSSKTLNRFKVSTALLNKECGMKKPSSVFEGKILTLLSAKFEDVVCQMTFEDLLSPKGYSLRFDFYIPSHDILVEADGSQHTDVAHPYYTDYTATCDKIKDSWCAEKGKTLIRIPYTKNVTKEYIDSFI